MRRAIIILTLASAILLLPAAPASASHPEPPPANGAATPSTDDCRPGADNDIVAPWTMMTQAEYEQMLLDDRGVQAGEPLPPQLIRPGGDDGLIDTWGELAHAAASATWEFCDHNDDGYACVMKQTAPTTAVGWSMAYTILDNHPFPG